MEMNENVLNDVAGGFEAPASKFDPGDKVRYLNPYGKEAVGIIYEAMYFAEYHYWKYVMTDLNGNIVCEIHEKDLLGIA